MKKFEKLYRLTYTRRNFFKELFLSMIYAFSSLPVLVMETILRRNMGERRFSLSNGILSLIIMVFIPILVNDDIHISFRGKMHISSRHFDAGEFFLDYTTWYIFLAAYLYLMIRRYEEICRLPSVFDMKRFSPSSGDIHPFFYSFQISGRRFNERIIEIVLEPLVFIIPGIFLYLIGQNLGYLLISLGLIYSFTMQLAYHAGEQEIINYIDIQIYSEEFSKLLEGNPSSETRGVRLYSRPISNPETKHKIIETFNEEESGIAID